MLRPDEPERADNSKSLATSLLVDNPILSHATAQRIATELVESLDGWRPWSEMPKYLSLPMVIVGRDALGFVHNATHMIVGKRVPDDQGWVEDWKQVTV
jgi:hypothetical protein